MLVRILAMVCLAALLTACKDNPSSADNDRPEVLISSTDSRFQSDHEHALKAYFDSALSKAGKSSALEGVLRLMVGHELGHAFERTHGSMAGMDKEDFADLFSLNMVAEIYSTHPRPYLATEEYATIMNAFLANVPTDAHLGRGGPGEMRRRRSLYSCVHFGIVADFARSDPFNYWAESLFIPPQDIPKIRNKPTFGRKTRADWLAVEIGKRLLAQRYLDAQGSLLPAEQLDRCIAVERRFREFLVAKLASADRTQRSIAEGSVIDLNDMNIGFQYFVPETEGANAVFAEATPSLPGTVPGISYLPWLLVKLGYFPGTSTKETVVLQYCGIGKVNAHLDLARDKITLTLCYEVGENILNNLDIYPKANGDLYKPMGEYAKENFPDYWRRSEEMMSDAK